MNTRKKLTATALVLACGGLLGATAASAQSDTTTSELPARPDVAVDDAGGDWHGIEVLDGDGFDHEFAECEVIEGPDFDELSDETKAEIRAEIEAENKALREAFDAAGIEYTEVPDDEFGVAVIEWDWDDEAAHEVADEVFSKLFGDFEVAGPEGTELESNELDIEALEDIDEADLDALHAELEALDGDFEDCIVAFDDLGCDDGDADETTEEDSTSSVQ